MRTKQAIKSSALAVCSSLGLALICAAPAKAGFFTTESGKTVLSYKWNGTVHYSVNSGSYRITGSAKGTVSNGIAAFSGIFSETHGQGGKCSGDLVFVPGRTATFTFDQDRRCPNSGETLKVDVPNRIADGAQADRIMAHDPGNDPYERINIRSSPGGEVVSTVVSGELGWRIESVGGWHKVRMDSGKTGWMHASVFVDSSTR